MAAVIIYLDTGFKVHIKQLSISINGFRQPTNFCKGLLRHLFAALLDSATLQLPILISHPLNYSDLLDPLKDLK